MILRRVIEHVKHQNWTAIAIDFVIVVMGVFIGIQVSNWNAARALKATEQSYLRQLSDEIRNIDQSLDYQIRYARRIVEAGSAGLVYLEGGVDCVNDCERLLVDFFHASQVWGTPFSTGTFRELERLGFPSKSATRDAVNNFYQYIDGWEVVSLTPSAFRERVRGHFSPAASAALWAKCWYSEGGQKEMLTFDCINDLKALNVRGMLKAIRADTELADQLRYWVGQNALSADAQGLPAASRLAAQAIAVIADEIEEAP